MTTTPPIFDGPGGSDRAELFALIGKFESRDNDHVIGIEWQSVRQTVSKIDDLNMNLNSINNIFASETFHLNQG